MIMSEQITDLAAALVAFQAEVTNPKKTGKNPHHNSTYAPLDEVINTVKPILAKHGLMVVQSTGTEGELITVTTRLIHKSGQWMESDVLKVPGSMKGRNEFSAQALGSAISYGRRYQLSAMLGIASEEDDDANAANGDAKQGGQDRRNDRNRGQGNRNPGQQGGQASAGKPAEPAASGPADGGEKLSAAQVSKIKTLTDRVAKAAGKKTDEVEKKLKEEFQYTSTTNLTKNQASTVIKKLEQWDVFYNKEKQEQPVN